jgi:hypothetical protein
MAQFTIRFPMYAIAKSVTKDASTGIDALSEWCSLDLNGDNGTSLKCIPLFTSRDSVQSYQSARLSHRQVWPAEMASARDLHTFLSDTQATAITHVLFDPVHQDGTTVLEPVPVELVIDTLRKTGCV